MVEVLREVRAGVVQLSWWAICAAVLAATLLSMQAFGVAVAAMLFVAAWMVRSRPGPWMVLGVAIAASVMAHAMRMGVL